MQYFHFPTKSLKNDDGYPCYHLRPIGINYDGVKWIAKSGIQLDNSIHFTDEEDAQLKENWKNICVEIDQKYDVFYYIGFRHPDSEKTLDRIEGDELVRKKFWPKLCTNLNNRSAKTVQRRIGLIFDKYFDGRDELTEDERNKMLRLMKKKWPPKTIYETLKLPFYFIVDFIGTMNKKKSYVFKAILKQLKMSESKFAKLLLEKSLKEIKKQFDKDANIEKVAEDYKLSTQNVREIWDMLVFDLMNTYQEYLLNYESDDEQKKEHCWNICKRTVIQGTYEVSDMMLFMRFLYKSVRSDTYVFKAKNFDKQKLLNKINVSEYEDMLRGKDVFKSNLFTRILRGVKAAQKEFFDHLDPKPTLKEKLMLISETTIREHALTDKYRKKKDKQLLFNVIYEYYTLRYKWKPPDILKPYADKVNDDVIDRIETIVKNDANKIRKRKIVENPVISRINVKVLKGNQEGRFTTHKRRFGKSGTPNISQTESILELSSIREEERQKTVRFEEVTETAEESDEESSQGLLTADETVLAAGGYNKYLNETMLEGSKSGFESLIISIPEESENNKQTAKHAVAVPTGRVDNWLDLLG